MTEVLVDDDLPDDEVYRMVGPAFWPPWHFPGGTFIIGTAFIASMRTLAGIMAGNLAAAYRPEGVP